VTMLIQESIRRYLIWRQASGAAVMTLKYLRSVFRFFITWAEGRGVTLLEQLTPDLFSAYQYEMTFRLTSQGRPISLGTQFQELCALRQWGRYLVEQDFLVGNPARKITLPRVPSRLPRVIPDVKEAIRIMASAGSRCTTSPMRMARGARDRASLELLYSAGLRRGEVVNLNVSDLDLVGGYVWVRQGKGKKDRVVPLGQMAITALILYLDVGRSVLLHGNDDGALFLNQYGGRLSGEGLHQAVKRVVADAKLSPKITSHALRHAAATHMLQNGAPIRHLQEFLGHASLESTQVYTHVTITDLKATHAKYHPREAMNNE